MTTNTTTETKAGTGEPDDRDLDPRLAELARWVAYRNGQA
jgi:hypothetical protein